MFSIKKEILNDSAIALLDRCVVHLLLRHYFFMQLLFVVIEYLTFAILDNYYVDSCQSLKEYFDCELLDEDRNLLTKQMIEHMRQQVLEYRRQFLASTG